MRLHTALLIVAPFVLVACSASGPSGRSHAHQQGAGGDNGQGSPADDGSGDPSQDDPSEGEGDNGNGGNDGGTVGGDAAGSDSAPAGDDGDAGHDSGTIGGCIAAKSGWRSMAAMPTSDTTTTGSELGVAWSGSVMFDLHHWATGTSPSFTYHDEAFAYDPVADAWQTLPLPPNPGFAYGLSLDGKWVLFGDGAGSYPMAGHVYDPSTKAWTAIPAAPLTPRGSFAIVAATTTHEIVLWGGLSEGSSAASELGDGAAYSLVTGKWRVLAKSPLPAGDGPMATWDGSRMIVTFPEIYESGAAPIAAAAAYDPATDAWTSLPLPAVKPRVDASYSTVSGSAGSLASMAFFGGFAFTGDGEPPMFHDGAWLDTKTGAWMTIADPGATLLPHQDWTFVTTFGANGRFYLWGGDQSDGDTFAARIDTGIFYDLTAGTWSTMDVSGAPSARREARVVWTGCDAIVFGGYGETGPVHDGARFRP